MLCHTVFKIHRFVCSLKEVCGKIEPIFVKKSNDEHYTDEQSCGI